MEDFTAHLTSFLAEHGLWAGPVVGLLAFGESLAIVGVLVPGTALLLSVGGLAGAGLVDPVWIALWTFVGAIAGNWASYALGRTIGTRAYRTWPLNRNRRTVARARLFFRNYGFAAVFLSRFLGPLRATVPVVAGVMEMGARRFHAANLISGVLWVPAILAPGFFAAESLGPEVELSERHVAIFAGGIVAITLAGTWLSARVLRGRR